MRKLLVSGLAAMVICAIAPHSARADLTVAAEVGPMILLDSLADTNVGMAFGGRLGYRIGLPVLNITPEVKLVYDRLPGAGDITAHAYGAMVGGRASVGALLSPCAFVHFGYGRVSAEGFDSQSGSAMDIGVGLDFTPIPFIDLGVQASYNRILSDVPVKWLAFQAQANIVF